MQRSTERSSPFLLSFRLFNYYTSHESLLTCYPTLNSKMMRQNFCPVDHLHEVLRDVINSIRKLGYRGIIVFVCLWFREHPGCQEDCPPFASPALSSRLTSSSVLFNPLPVHSRYPDPPTLSIPFLEGYRQDFKMTYVTLPLSPAGGSFVLDEEKTPRESKAQVNITGSED